HRRDDKRRYDDRRHDRRRWRRGWRRGWRCQRNVVRRCGREYENERPQRRAVRLVAELFTEQLDADFSGSPAEIVVERGERNVAADRKIKIGRVIGREFMGATQRENVIKSE